jgi:hypothetical protein
MDIRIHEVNSRVQTMDSPALMEPRILREIVRLCVRAVKDELAHDRRMNEQLRLSNSISPDEHR